MNRLTIAASLIAAGLAAAAQAQMGPGGPDPYGEATVARADEEARAGERFAALDTDKDGAITGGELEAAMSQRNAQGPGRGGFGLRRTDTDGDGKITREEYVTAQLRRFDMQDADRNGQLTKAERDAARAERARGGWGGAPVGQ